MTPVDFEDYSVQYEQMMTEIGKSLKDTLVAARDQNRVKYGVLQAAKAMETPDNVMLCILTVDDIEDLTAHMYRTLIEAFCCENEIRVIKVDSAKNVAKLFTNTKNVNLCSPKSNDFGFVLIEYPTNELSVSEEDVMEYCERSAFICPQPIVHLPD